jgi:hypothetical protein
MWLRSVDACSSARCESKRSARVVPAHLQSSPEFLVRYVQVALRLLNARVAEHQLNDSDIDAVGKQPARAFVSEVVPPQIDFPKLLSVPFRAGSGRPRGDTVGQEP